MSAPDGSNVFSDLNLDTLSSFSASPGSFAVPSGYASSSAPTLQGVASSATTKQHEHNAGLACPFEKEADMRGGNSPCRGCAKAWMTKVRAHVKETHMSGLRFHQRCGLYFNNEPEFTRHDMTCRANVVRHRTKEAKEQAWMELFDFLFPGQPRPGSPYNLLVAHVATSARAASQTMDPARLMNFPHEPSAS